ARPDEALALRDARELRLPPAALALQDPGVLAGAAASQGVGADGAPGLPVPAERSPVSRRETPLRPIATAPLPPAVPLPCRPPPRPCPPGRTGSRTRARGRRTASATRRSPSSRPT